MKEVLLVGNPNTGKTTLFNSLTKSDEHVGNWHGVTVENKSKSFFVQDEEFVLVDTPGVYSLCALSFEEGVAVDTIASHKESKVVNICDRNNLQRNLFLTLCLLEEGCKIVLAVNEIDKKSIFKVDYGKLSKVLGVPVVGIDAEDKKEVDALKKLIAQKEKHESVSKPAYIKKLKWQKTVKIENGFDEELLLVKAYEKDEKFFESVGLESKTFFDAVPKDSILILSELRYAFIDEVIEKCTKRTDEIYGKSKFDKVALSKIFSIPLFFLILAGVFYLTFFSFGAFLSDCTSKLLGLISSPILSFIEEKFASTWVYELFNVAIFGGIGTVLSFLPQVVLLFFFLFVLEDSGYMSRIAFVFEDVLGKIGLSGKSVYTLLMGFGCSTSAIMTARNMDDKNAKIKTAILCPYMSCSAKIPVYTVVGGAFFGAKNLLVIFGLYLLGVVVAIAISKIFDMTILKSKDQSFILEFPPYRMTSLKRVGKILWKNVKEFVLRVGTIMLSMNVVIWCLSSFSIKFSYVANGEGVSILESLGKILAPIFAPLGFGNWAIVASLLAGLVAKEVVVSSIAMFNGIEAGATGLISSSILLSGSVVYFSSKASVLSFLVFCLLYTPCIASVSMLASEIGKRWTALSIIIQLFTAYVVSLIIFNIFFAFEIFGFWSVILVLLAFIILIFSILFIIKKIKKKECGHCKNCSKNCKRKQK